MTKEDNEDLENSTKCSISDNDYIDGNVKARDHCHISGKYRRSAHRDCNINVKLNHKILPYFARNCPRLWGNCAFPQQNFHTRKLGEITGFCAVL